jgi:hypothetical protein
MNLRDERSVREQVGAGLRLAGFVFLTFALFLLLMMSTVLLVNGSEGFLGKQYLPHLDPRIIGSSGLIALALLMFVTAKYWAKWFVGFLGYVLLKTIFLPLFVSRSHSVPSALAPRFWFIELLLILIALAALSLKYVERIPRKIEALGLITVVVAFSFFLALNSTIPLLVGMVTLGLAQAADLALVRHRSRDVRKGPPAPRATQAAR